MVYGLKKITLDLKFMKRETNSRIREEFRGVAIFSIFCGEKRNAESLKEGLNQVVYLSSILS